MLRFKDGGEGRTGEERAAGGLSYTFVISEKPRTTQTCSVFALRPVHSKVLKTLQSASALKLSEDGSYARIISGALESTLQPSNPVTALLVKL